MKIQYLIVALKYLNNMKTYQILLKIIDLIVVKKKRSLIVKLKMLKFNLEDIWIDWNKVFILGNMGCKDNIMIQDWFNNRD
jgi:hypothetical protein